MDQDDKAQRTVKKLSEDGYCILNDVFDTDVVEAKRGLINEIISQQEDGLVDPFSLRDEYLLPQRDAGIVPDVYKKYPGFRELAEDERIIEIVERLLGENICTNSNYIIYKPSGTDNEVSVHREVDPQYTGSPRYIAWIPLCDATEENGCLKAIEGSHTPEEVATWRETSTDRGVERYDPEAMSYIEMNAGDVLLFHHHLIHGSDDVTTAQPRYAYRVMYQRPVPAELPDVGCPVMIRRGNVRGVSKDG